MLFGKIHRRVAAQHDPVGDRSRERGLREKVASGGGTDEYGAFERHVRRVVLHIHTGYDTRELDLALHARHDGNHLVLPVCGRRARHGDARIGFGELVGRIAVGELDGGRGLVQIGFGRTRCRRSHGGIVIYDEDEFALGVHVGNRRFEREGVGAVAVVVERDVARHVVLAQEFGRGGIGRVVNQQCQLTHGVFRCVVRGPRGAAGVNHPFAAGRGEGKGDGNTAVVRIARTGRLLAASGQQRGGSEECGYESCFHCVISFFLFAVIRYSDTFTKRSGNLWPGTLRYTLASPRQKPRVRAYEPPVHSDEDQQ